MRNEPHCAAKPSKKIEDAVVQRVEKIVEMLKTDPEADIGKLRAEIDERIFDLFEIHESRDEVLRFYESIGKVDDESDEGAAQAANE